MSDGKESNLGSYREDRVSHPFGLPGIQIELNDYAVGECVKTAELVSQAEDEGYSKRQVYGAIAAAVDRGWIRKVGTNTYEVCGESKTKYKAKRKPNMPEHTDEGGEVLDSLE
ncbi:hypothetical protein [Levilactobacillus huananensis]|uniref:hypothetical protein n=1 Tax=Levilactobacillus huananensis TaxID=2486019 RepID=UPI0013DE674A|nr:hypothetical protein [Levilactobacillus huananensis]